MSRAASPRRPDRVPAAGRTSAPAPVRPLAPAGEPPSLLRDPWAWAALGVVLLLLVRSWGAPFGEPVADDFDHLHHVLFAHDRSWWGGGGSASFWRPLAYQGYYGALSGVILTHPVWIAALHAALVALTVLIVHDIARRHVAAPLAAIAATFPWLVESARALVLVPVHFVDLGLIVFSALAWRLAVARRRWLAWGALLAALFCKETAVATALALPWLAHTDSPRARRTWFLGSLAVVAAWGLAYVAVRSRFALALPHGLESGLSPALFFQPQRYGWAIAGTLRALVSLPMRAAAYEPFVVVAALLVVGAAAVLFATDAAARARLAGARRVIVAGLGWGVLASATLLTVYPVWSPERVVYSALGPGLALTVLLAAAHPMLPVALLVLRLVTFAAAPAAPARVTLSPPETGAFVDFERLTRLQRLMVEARTTLRREFPTLPRGAGVAMLHPPFMADYAAGDKALQVWYRDSTVRWLKWDQMAANEGRTAHGALEFQADATPSFRRIEPAALRLLFVAGGLERASRYADAVDLLARADSLQRDREAHHMLGRILGLRAWCLGGAGRVREAEQVARQSLAIAPENADGHLTMSAILNGRNEWSASLRHLDTLETWYPGYPAAVEMRKGILVRMSENGIEVGRRQVTGAR
jgi:hypothetical protein